MTVDRSRSMGVLAQLMTCLVVALGVFWVSGTATASAPSFISDSPTIAGVDVRQVITEESETFQLSAAREVSVSASGEGRGTTTTRVAAVNATNNGGGEHSERELKEAENELRRNKDFRNWFHRNYKADVVRSVGDRSNPDLDREQVRDAFEEWIECGKPRSK
jgi:hypothetical protein